MGNVLRGGPLCGADFHDEKSQMKAYDDRLKELESENNQLKEENQQYEMILDKLQQRTSIKAKVHKESQHLRELQAKYDDVDTLQTIEEDQNIRQLTPAHVPRVSLHIKNPESFRKAKANAKIHHSTQSSTKWVPDDAFRINSALMFHSISQSGTYQQMLSSLDALNHSQIATKNVLVIGQATVELRQSISSSFSITIYNEEDTQAENYLKLTVDHNAAEISYFNKNEGTNALQQTKLFDKILQKKR
eukprot:489892_1